ncbi:MAG: VOC family protein [Chloroflexi bacterium]|nr:MAG: VOC family protein [Chloroflexota bacterium]
MFAIKRLNHAVLYVRNAQRAMEFYRDTLGFRVVEDIGGRAYFMQTSGSENHHDLGLFEVGADAPGPSRGDRVGLYHLAWETETLPDLAPAFTELVNAGAFTGQSDHGASLSLYGKDPDGNEFELFWAVPREEWTTRGFDLKPLDLTGELHRRGFTATTT